MPKIIDHDQRRVHLVDAFLSVAEVTGIERASTPAMARAAGISPGGVWHYFDGRKAILHAALRRLEWRIAARLEAAAGAHLYGQDSLEAVCLAALPLDLRRRLDHGLWLNFWSYGRSDAIVRRRQRAAHGRWRAFLSHQVSSAQGASPLERRTTARTLAAVVDGLAVQLALQPTPGAAAIATRILRRELSALACPAHPADRPHAHTITAAWRATPATPAARFNRDFPNSHLE